MAYVAVTGSRGFADFQLMERELEKFLKKKDIIVSGGAMGADRLAERYAEKHGHRIEVLHADWNKHGAKAGKIRNRQIIKKVSHCISFWDGVSPGTKHDKCVRIGKPSYENHQI